MNVKRCFVAPDLIVTMLTTGYVVGAELSIAQGLPAGAVLTAIGWDVARSSWAFDFYHRDFEYTCDGSVPPELEVHIQKKSAKLTDALTE